MIKRKGLNLIPYANHDEWLQIRKQYIGGSDAGAILGLNPYSSAYSVWAEKTGKIPAFEGNIATRTGQKLESFVAELFQEETGKKVQKCNYTIVNPAYPFACANIDRELVNENAILEIKTTNSYVNVKKFKNGEFPEQWYGQVVHYAMVTGAEKAYLAVLSECRDFRIFEIERDEAEIAALAKAEAEFWEKVKNNTPPQPDGSSSSSEAINAIYSNPDGSVVDLFGMEKIFAYRASLKKSMDDLSTEVKALDNQIKEQMGAATKGTCDKWTVSWGLRKSGSLDREAIKRDYPSIDFTKYQKESRVFVINEKRSKS